jgi:S-adenosylmethionine:tRNA ribosyltransferase-isomerase
MFEELDQYDYSFPPELIAQAPASPRDSARLLVYEKARDTITLTTFNKIIDFLPPRSVLVANNSKVVPARLFCVKENGQRVEIFYIRHGGTTITALAKKGIEAGQILTLKNNVSFTVASRQGKYVELIPSFPLAEMFSILDRFGTTPIPPYIKHSPLPEKKLQEEYQTVFAKTPGSVAAPTASLHFTPELLQKIEEAGHAIAYVTLHVNLGTFAPLTQDQLATGRLHEEYFSIDQKTADTLNTAKDQGRPIIAVGTTTVRTLESAAKNGHLETLSGSTDIFIRPGYTFTFVDGLLTNFHVPKSSLMMLVAAFIGRETLLQLYQKAIAARFRLFSFGDAMLIV